MKQSRFLLHTVAALFIVCIASTSAHSDQALDSTKILKTAVISNGKSIYETGRRETGTDLAFTAGPNWLHVDGGGCIECHGKRGWGSMVPTFCTSTTPPITFKYLAGNGYPLAARQDGTHPAYTEYSFKALMRSGVKPTGYEADFCMPRYFISIQEMLDLLGYLIELDKE